MMNDYNKLIREHFDISDTPTRKCIVALEDSEQTQLLTALTSSLYDKIMEKVDEIDFGSIPNSRGDITKVDGFESTVECLNIIRRIVVEYKENPDIVDNVLGAIENIRSRKSMFMKAYALNIDFPMVLYNLIVMAIEQSVSFLIAVCIQYIKDPATQSMVAALDKVAYNNSRNNLLYEQLVSFNNACATKELDYALNDIIKNGGKIAESALEFETKDGSVFINININNKECDVEKGEKSCSPFQELPPCDNEEKECLPNDVATMEPEEGEEIIHEPEPEESEYDDIVQEDIADIMDIVGKGTDALNKFKGSVPGKIVIGATILSLGLKSIKFILKCLIPMLRNITYFWYNSKMKLSDSLSVQAQFLEANAYKLQYSTINDMDDKKRAKVVEKQLKWAEKLKRFSNVFAIDNKTSEKRVKDLTKEEVKKAKVEDIKDQLPADIYAKSVLF